jgi:glutamate-1-semialdehyde aminotransferase
MERPFGLPYWQFSLTGTDANRFTIRLAITARQKILVFNSCDHGSVDETIVTIEEGVEGPRPGSIGPPVDPAEAAAADDHELARYTHPCALNRGILLTPLHTMAPMSPATTEEDVDRHSTVFDEMCAELVA